MAGALTPHLTDSNYDEHSEDEDDDDVEKKMACQKSEEYNEWILESFSRGKSLSSSKKSNVMFFRHSFVVVHIQACKFIFWSESYLLFVDQD